jgi:Tol biopolymer transport system component
LVNRGNGRAGRKCRMTLGIATPAISADGRLIAFACLGPGGDQQIFVRDLRRQTTALVSRAAGIAGALGNSDSYAPAISADGRIVAFQSQANNLTQDMLSGEGPLDVFVRDLGAATTTLASRASGPAGATGNNRVLLRPALSADGRLVAFTSSAALTPDDLDDNTDVLVRDQAAAITTLVSRATGSQGAKGDRPSGAPSISGDGRFVAFGSAATNLTSDLVGGGNNVFVREL